MTVEFGTVHAGELHFAAHGHAAGAAHAEAVHHEGVEAHGGGHVVAAGEIRHGLHHGHRAHGHHFGDVAALAVEAVADKIGHDALLAFGTVVRGNKHFVAEQGEFLFKEQKILVARADAGNDVVAGLVMALGNVMHGGHARAAAHADDLLRRFKALNVGRAAERSANVVDVLPFFEFLKHLGGAAEHQIHDGDGAVFLVGVGNGQRETLALLIHAENDEMTRTGRGGDLRSVQHELAGAPGNQLFLMQNFRGHKTSMPPCACRETASAPKRQTQPSYPDGCGGH